MIEEELRRIKTIGTRALSLVTVDRVEEAAAVLNELEGSWATSDSLQVELPIQALILFKQGELRKAKELSLKGLRMIWGNKDLLYFIRQCRDSCDIHSANHLYSLTVSLCDKRPRCWLGLGSGFEVDFEVIASNLEEALEHSSLLLGCSLTQDMLKNYEIFMELPRYFDGNGVYHCSKFRRAKSSD